MRALVLGLMCSVPIAAHAQIGCQKWADGSETCYYADGRTSEGRRQIDGSTQWTENRPKPAATPGAAAADLRNESDAPDSMRGGIGNTPQTDYINPWEHQRPGAVGNALPIGVPDGAIGNCGQRGASLECDTPRRR